EVERMLERVAQDGRAVGRQRPALTLGRVGRARQENHVARAVAVEAAGVLEQVAHRDVADAGVRDTVGPRTGVTEDRQDFVVELEASALYELQHGDRGDGLRETAD